MNLQLNPATNSLTGTVTFQGEVFVVELSRTFPAFSKKEPTPHAGKYTLLLGLPLEAVGSTSVPQGTSYATATVSPTGLIKIVGKLTDGKAFSTGSVVNRLGRFPFYAAPYKKQMGSLAGGAGFLDTALSDLAGAADGSGPRSSRVSTRSARRPRSSFWVRATLHPHRRAPWRPLIRRKRSG